MHEMTSRSALGANWRFEEDRAYWYKSMVSFVMRRRAYSQSDVGDGATERWVASVEWCNTRGIYHSVNVHSVL